MKRFRPRAFAVFVGVTVLSAYAFHMFFAVSFWAAWVIIAIAVLLNGWIAALEDDGER